MRVPSELQEVVDSTADTLSGGLRFKGTRVLVRTLFDYVARGKSLTEFLDHFPDVSEGQARKVLAWERSQVLADLEQAG